MWSLNLDDRLRFFHQLECLKCNGHGLSVSCVEWPLLPHTKPFPAGIEFKRPWQLYNNTCISFSSKSLAAQFQVLNAHREKETSRLTLSTGDRELLYTSQLIREIFGHNRLHVDILRFSFIKSGYIQSIPLKRSVIFLHSRTSTGYFSNSTGSFVTNCRFSPIINTSQWSRRFLGIIGWDPSVSKSNRLHVDILRFFHNNLRYIP